MRPGAYLLLLPMLLQGFTATASADIPQTHGMSYDLPELEVRPRNKPVLHLLGFVREYSSLATHTDTIYLFREKWVDFMVPGPKAGKYKGWLTPRLISSRSYYRFADGTERDSVSDRCGHHFSYADWIGLPAGKWRGQGTSETRLDGQLALSTDILADTLNRALVPAFGRYFRSGIDFDRFNVSYSFADTGTDVPDAADLTGMTFDISSEGRGRSMFRFNRDYQNIYVTTRGEMYVVERQFISVGEAKKWLDKGHSLMEMSWETPPGLPELPAETARLIERVNSIDHTSLRLNRTPSQRLVNTLPRPPKQTFLQYLKSLFVH
ncbi:MAG: hypothetical protein K2L26_04720 [Duncaniella sp.]|nr:hypothetical protein [Duncaniella sp.]